jgi:hypothetical protein
MEPLTPNKKIVSSKIVKIKSIAFLTHDTLKIVTDKPKDFNFIPGQATSVSINIDGWKDDPHPFTITSIPENDYLEFIIKTYAAHKGVTSQLVTLKSGDELILHEVFGAIHYEDEGLFIAGGAGITPFISILKYLKSKNKLGSNSLLYANKSQSDIIMESELSSWLGERFKNILSEEKKEGYEFGFISEKLIKENINNTDSYVYVCGPPMMISAVLLHLQHLGFKKENIIKEM